MQRIILYHDKLLYHHRPYPLQTARLILCPELNCENIQHSTPMCSHIGTLDALTVQQISHNGKPLVNSRAACLMSCPMRPTRLYNFLKIFFERFGFVQAMNCV